MVQPNTYLNRGRPMRWTNHPDMHDSPRERPFSPPPAPATGFVGKGLIFLLALFALYQGANWVLKQRMPITTRPAETSPATQAPYIPKTPAPEPFSAPQPSPQDDSASAPHIVKCVVNGKTSYGDAPCAQGAVSSQLKTRRDHNLMAAVRPQPVRPSAPEEPTQQPVSATPSRPMVNIAAARKAECQQLDAAIKQFDAESRQPQSAQRQDWIRSQRQNARDRQFRLSCA